MRLLTSTLLILIALSGCARRAAPTSARGLTAAKQGAAETASVVKAPPSFVAPTAPDPPPPISAPSMPLSAALPPLPPPPPAPRPITEEVSVDAPLDITHSKSQPQGRARRPVFKEKAEALALEEARVVKQEEAKREEAEREEAKREAEEMPRRSSQATPKKKISKNKDASKRKVKRIVLDEILIEGALLKPEVDLLSSNAPSPNVASGEDDVSALGTLGWLDTFEPDIEAARAAELARPEAVLPRVFYFENTYLGGNAAYLERLRKLDEAFAARPYRLARLPPQPLDPPTHAGLALTAQLNARALDQPRRVLLQVGLRGSERFGWRRPPLDVALIAYHVEAEPLTRALKALMRRLDLRDRLSLIIPGAPNPIFAPLSDIDALRRRLIHEAPTAAYADGPALSQALLEAEMMMAASGHEARIPGTQIALLLTGAEGEADVERGRAAAHQMNLTGVTTSVIHLGEGGGWWRVASAGHGNLHRAAGLEGLEAAIEGELESLSRIIARLLRINIRLAPDVSAIRVLGSRVLAKEEVAQVKAREVAVDLRLSETLGVKSDRGEDDDGVQTVIPYFYGGDTHVILVELWVEHPGPVADVTLKYKDMVQMRNATAQAAVALSARPMPARRFERQVARNAADFHFAEQLAGVATRLKR
ncbi:hypothetical protein KJ940_19425, partial [Myxococcota bacterium]|nr:hypothetical protein [Myxococcota bacterium]